jgi:endonuclease/exonuclease/phosphatase family metal-dependent hydrolase
MRSRPIRTLLLLLVGVLALLPVSTPAQAAAAPRTLNIWMWNIAGWKMHDGSTSNGLIQALTSSIQNRDADFAALNEVCESQYHAVINALRAANWPVDEANFARFEVAHPTGCGGAPSGIALFSREPLGSANRFKLPDDGRTEKRKLLCAPLAANPALRFCTTHITTSNEVINGEPISLTQLEYVNDRVDEFHADGGTAVIAGDFNAQPNYGRINGWYSSTLDTPNNRNNTGNYRELDDNDAGNCIGYGENTVAEADPPGPCGPGKKIDLIFAHDDRITGGYSGDSLSISQSCGGPCSDHRIVIGTVTVLVG